MSIAVYPRCIRLTFGPENELGEFEEHLRSQVAAGEATCRKSGEVWLGDVRLGSMPIITGDGRRMLLIRRSGRSLVCHNLENGKQEAVDSEEITNTLIHMFFVSFRATIWSWAQECIGKLSGLAKGKVKVNWKQALLGQGLEQEDWASSEMIHVWNLLRKSALTEIWWLHNRSLVEDTTKITAKYLIQQVWLSLRLSIILEWVEVVKSKDKELALQFDSRWLSNGFAGMRTRQWVLWLWEEPLMISKLNFRTS